MPRTDLGNIRYYCVIIDDPKDAIFSEYVDRILSDPRGWRKYGYSFVRVPVEYLDDPSINYYILPIRIANAEVLQRECKTKLSCYRSTHEIFINSDNFNGASRISQEKLPYFDLEHYRTYVINHEVGHSLGLDHPKWYNSANINQNASQCDPRRNGRRGSVMMQMSKGSEHISPCMPNCWPLDPDEYNEFDNAQFIDYNQRSIIVLLLVIVLISIAIIVLWRSKNNIKGAVSKCLFSIKDLFSKLV